jgi:hypothetical protein
MIISREGGMFYVDRALLKSGNGQAVRNFHTSEQVIEYLKQHPDETFFLEPWTGSLGAELQGPAENYGPQTGDVFCGQLRFKLDTGQVECI